MNGGDSLRWVKTKPTPWKYIISSMCVWFKISKLIHFLLDVLNTREFILINSTTMKLWQKSFIFILRLWIMKMKKVEKRCALILATKRSFTLAGTNSMTVSDRELHVQHLRSYNFVFNCHYNKTSSLFRNV